MALEIVLGLHQLNVVLGPFDQDHDGAFGFGRFAGDHSIEQFGFEEAEAGHAHEHYLWGHACLAVALLLGRAFEDSAWDMSPGDVQDLDDLPAHIVRRDGEAHMQACAEAFLTERAATTLLEHGLMPLLSYKNRNAARLLRCQSVSSPARALSGAWNA
eukprot:gene30605-37848_t